MQKLRDLGRRQQRHRNPVMFGDYAADLYHLGIRRFPLDSRLQSLGAVMRRIFAAFAVSLMGGALQAQWLQQPTPGSPMQASVLRPVDTTRSRDTFDQHGTACAGRKDSAGGSNTLASPPRGGVSVRTLAHKPSKAAGKAFHRGVRAWNEGQSD
jgi:hypothetical protein